MFITIENSNNPFLVPEGSASVSDLVCATESLRLRGDNSSLPVARPRSGSAEAPWTKVESGARRASLPGSSASRANSPAVRVRWSDETEADITGATPQVSVSNDLGWENEDAWYTRDRPQGHASYIGGRSGGIERNEITPVWNRVPLNSIPDFSGGNFRGYYFKIHLLLRTYPESERYPLLISKLSPEVISELLANRDYADMLFADKMGLEDAVHFLALAFPEDKSVIKGSQEDHRGLPMSEVPIFNGAPGDNFETWYQRAVMYLATYKPEEKFRRLCSRLGPKPFEFVQNRAEVTQRNFPALIADLRRQYAVPLSKSGALKEFYTRKQGNCESLAEFEGTLRKFAKAAFPDLADPAREKAILQRLLEGTRSVELSRHSMFFPPENLREVHEVADRISQNHLLAAQDRARSRPPEPLEVSRPSQYPVVENRRDRSTAYPGTGTPWAPQRNTRQANFQSQGQACFNCGKFGHYRRECPGRNLYPNSTSNR